MLVHHQQIDKLGGAYGRLSHGDAASHPAVVMICLVLPPEQEPRHKRDFLTVAVIKFLQCFVLPQSWSILDV